MKLYLAALYSNNFSKGSTTYERLTEREKQARDDVQNILESYHYVHRASAVAKMRADGAKVFLDSGAFSAFTKGVKVDVEAYCEYIKSNSDILEEIDGRPCASVLDGIGDPKLTWENQARMETLGVCPLPCFHYGEDERYLDWYIENYPYITLGGMVPISTPQLIHWLDRIWKNHLCDRHGVPKLKVHGFGLTTISLMERYPWYSVDSSSWVQMAGNGTILLPEFGALSVSEKSPQAKDSGRHVDTVPPMQRKAIEDLLNQQGFELERLRTEYVSRWVYNCWSFGELSAKLNKTKSEIFLPVYEGLF